MPKVNKITKDLAHKVIKLEQPIHVLAVCSGGRTVGKYLKQYLSARGISTTYNEVWTNIIRGKASVWKTSFKAKNYKGTALIVDDVIWKGRSVNATKKMLLGMKKKRVYTATLLDCNHKADFSIFN
ncbi:MAG: phosphoribosyltransferase family protein [Minisyncoccia bacterium]